MHTRNAIWLGLGLGLLGCGPPTWQAARQANDAAVYEAFARENTQLRHADVALSKAKKLRWDHAKEVGDAPSWAAYLRLDGAGDRADFARQRYEEISFDDAMDSEDATALERYLHTFPQGVHFDDAKKTLDKRFWDEASVEDTATAYRRYLLRMPEGKYREEAEFNYEGRVWERTIDDDRVRGYRKYLKGHRTGVNADRCHARIAELTFTKIRVGIVLAESIHADRESTLNSLKKWTPEEVKIGFKAAGFEVTAVEIADLGAGRDGREVFAIPEGEGLLLIDIREEEGQVFEPSGRGTLIQGEMRLYVSTRDQPLFIQNLQVQTGNTVTWVDISGLEASAHLELGVEIGNQAGRLLPWQAH